MTQNHNSYLFLQRLIVIKHLGGVAYDETFHEGVNIIRGKNSSGKSTISNLIFFALGGDYNNWNPESLRCQEVYAQVEINNAIYTFKRKIEVGRPGMAIYWGSFEEGRKDLDGWKHFSYAQGDQRLSFSNALFSALAFPSVTDGESRNINMNQVLRLLYIDQDSPTQKLFRFENFDSPLTRQAISELLMGVYDDQLYTNRLDEKKKIKERDDLERDYNTQIRAFQRAGAPSNIEELNTRLSGLEVEISQVNVQISEAKAARKMRLQINSKLGIETLQAEATDFKSKLTSVSDQIYQQDIDILDSRQFIEMLEHRVVELDKSIVVRKSLGELSLTYCPECLVPLDEDVAEDACFLCKKTLPQDELRTHAKRLKQELELQIKESKMLLANKEADIVKQRTLLPEIKHSLIATQRKLDKAIEESQSTRDDVIDSLLLKRGGLERQVEVLNAQLAGLAQLEEMKSRLLGLAREIARLQLEIQTKEAEQIRNIQFVKDRLQQITLYLLKNDLERQKEFKQAKHVNIDFYDDGVALDGNFNFSASSNTYLKNAARFSLFFASLQLNFMRYPRFILCDNMEDKGMEKERTQNFQSLIVKLSEQFKEVRHQVIFSTSMIADELDGTVYCVGEYYDQDHKTLKV